MFKMESHMMKPAIAVRLHLVGVLADHIAREPDKGAIVIQ